VKKTLLALALAALATTARAESDRWGSFEIGAGTYTPNIDAEPLLSTTPFANAFGGRGWMFHLAVAKSVFTRVGSLEVGLGSGYYRRSGYGHMANAPTVASGDPTTFNIIPVTLSLTYRADFLYEWWSIPLVPYGRASLERYNWWITNGNGNTAKYGATNGYSGAVGVVLILDFFDPGLARELDADTGINHTALFIEAGKSKIDDFGSKKSWDLSEKHFTYTGGLLFIF
jgi:hypothetical protein